LWQLRHNTGLSAFQAWWKGDLVAAIVNLVDPDFFIRKPRWRALCDQRTACSRRVIRKVLPSSSISTTAHAR
jgi:hypothetical protein